MTTQAARPEQAPTQRIRPPGIRDLKLSIETGDLWIEDDPVRGWGLYWRNLDRRYLNILVRLRDLSEQQVRGYCSVFDEPLPEELREGSLQSTPTIPTEGD